MSIAQMRRNAFERGEIHDDALEYISDAESAEEVFNKLEDFYETAPPEWMYQQAISFMIGEWDKQAKDPEHLER